ncbi:MAG: hypothetical protein GF350_03410 [Chitinivibrionales bacterium]|nr:hypothetical protein [Chitinivibrionales bacterium]
MKLLAKDRFCKCVPAISAYVLAAAVAGVGLYFLYPAFTYNKIRFIIPLLLVMAFLYDMLKAGKASDKTKLRTMQIIVQKISPHGISLLLFLTAVMLNISVLWEIWSKGMGHLAFTISGYIPYSDAGSYCAGAHHLVEFGTWDTWNSMRRPLPVGLYAVLLKVAGLNYQTTVFLAMILVAISIFYAAREMYKIFGFTSGVLMLVFCTLFYSRFNGTFLTEPFGLLFGNCAFVFLAKGVYLRRKHSIVAGLFLSGLSQGVRAGAYCILPALIIYAAYSFRKNCKSVWQYAGLCLAIVFLSLSLSPLLVRVIGTEGDGYQLSNFSYTLYGIAKGGEGWTQFYQDYPRSRQMPENEQSKLAARMAIKFIKEKPSLFVKTIVGTMFYNVREPVDFLFPVYFPGRRAAFWILLICTLAGLIMNQYMQEKKVLHLLLVAVAGIFISSPFLVDGTSRVYAATIPFNCALLSAGAGMLFRLIWRRAGAQMHHRNMVESKCSGNAAFSIITVLLLLGGPIFVKCTRLEHDLDHYAKLQEHYGDYMIVFRAAAAPYIHVVANGEDNNTIPEVHVSSYRKNNPAAVWDKQFVFSDVSEGDYLVGAFNLITRRWTFMVVREDITRYKDELLYAEVQMHGKGVFHDLFKAEIINNNNID